MKDYLEELLKKRRAVTTARLDKDKQEWERHRYEGESFGEYLARIPSKNITDSIRRR